MFSRLLPDIKLANMTIAEFVRLYPLRCKNIAWLFGAGTSVSAGMPTAWDLIQEFKKRIYCSEQGYPLSMFKNTSDPAIRKQIQTYFDSKSGYPVCDSVEEYSFYFEMAFPNATDRSNFLMQQLSGMQNSYGHKVIGILMKNNLLPQVYTTNFDKAFENAAVDQLKTHDRFFVGSIDNADTTVTQYNSGFRPLIVKLHGDYFSNKLKNTEEELLSQDVKLRGVLNLCCCSNGLAVMGYSGRDQSIMEVLNKALDSDIAFPQGIFWFIRKDSSPLQPVTEFIDKAKSKGIQAEYIEIETFDTAWAEIAKGMPELPQEDRDRLNENYFRTSNTKPSDKGTKYPVIRLNAVKISELPTTARLIECSAGNTKEIEALISDPLKVFAIRKRSGIVGFGSDKDFAIAFDSYQPLKKDVYSITAKEYAHEDSTIKGLLTKGLAMALVRERPLRFLRKKNKYFIVPDPKQLTHVDLNVLQSAVSVLTGNLPNGRLTWTVAVEISIHRKFSEAFMCIEPTVLVSRTNDVSLKKLAAPFVKEKTARWYNSKYAEILDAWLNVFFGKEENLSISAFSSEIDGFNAPYKLVRKAPFARSN